MKKLKALYEKSKAAKVGDTCVCPSCKTPFIKTSYQQAFCKSKGGSKCKDLYWNKITPEKRNNTTRISPASASYMAYKSIQREAMRRSRPSIGVWSDDDWNEGNGGSGVSNFS